jgi:hypothetical protein
MSQQPLEQQCISDESHKVHFTDILHKCASQVCLTGLAHSYASWVYFTAVPLRCVSQVSHRCSSQETHWFTSQASLSGMFHRHASQVCLTGMCHKCASQVCLIGVSHTFVLYLTGVTYRCTSQCFPQMCLTSVTYRCASQVYITYVP